MTVNITLDKEAETAFKPVRLIMEITSPEALSSIKKLAALDVSIPKLVAEKSSFSFQNVLRWRDSWPSCKQFCTKPSGKASGGPYGPPFITSKRRTHGRKNSDSGPR